MGLVLLLPSDFLQGLFETCEIGRDHSVIIDFGYLLHYEILQLIEPDHDLALEVVVPLVVVFYDLIEADLKRL